MIKLDQRGAFNVLVVPLFVLVLCFIGAAAFGAWAYQNGQKYKNDSDALSAEAVSKAVQAEDAKKDAAFAIEAKNPLQTFNGPSAYGSVVLKYPKNWSAYVIEPTTSGGTPLNAYFYPLAVPDANNQSNTYALRVEILNQSYATVLQQYQNTVGKSATAIPYSFPTASVKSVIGTRITGVLQNDNNKRGDLVIMPLRNTTLEVWTEAAQFQSDFDTNILPNISFIP